MASHDGPGLLADEGDHLGLAEEDLVDERAGAEVLLSQTCVRGLGAVLDDVGQPDAVVADPVVVLRSEPVAAEQSGRGQQLPEAVLRIGVVVAALG